MTAASCARLRDTLSGNLADCAHRSQIPVCGCGAQLYIPVSNCLMWANHLHEKKSHSLTLSPFTICTFAVNKGGWGDREKSQRVWLACCPPCMLICIKWLPSTLELFSTSSCRQMRLAVRREPRSVSMPD